MDPRPPVGSPSYDGPGAADQPSLVGEIFSQRSKFSVIRQPAPEEPRRILLEWEQMEQDDKFLYHAYPCLPDFHASLFGQRVLCSLELPSSQHAFDMSAFPSSQFDSHSDSVVVSQGRSGAIMQGYLDKRPLIKGSNDIFVPSAFKPYKRRYFVLKNQQLIYYKAPPLNEHTKEVGKWSLTGAAILLQDKDNIQLKIYNDTKVYSLRGAEGADMKEWYDLLCSETNIQAFSQESPASVSASSMAAASPGSRHSTSALTSGSVALPERLSRSSSFNSSKARSRRSASLSQILSQKIKSKEIASNGSVLSYMLSDLYGHRFFDDIDIEQQTAPLLSLHPEPVCNPIRVIIKPMQLSFKFFRDNCDIFYFRMAIYDFERRLKVSEDFTYMICQPGAQSQQDHLADMAAWTKMNSINEGVGLNFELPKLSDDNPHTATDSQRGVFSLTRLSPGLHVVVWISKQLQDLSAKIAEPFLISRELTEPEKQAYNKKARDRKKEWSPAFHQTFVWGSFPLFEKHPKIKDHFQLMPSNVRKIERFYRVHGDVQNPFDIFKQMEYVLHPGSFAILPETMKEILHISANFEVLMPPKDVLFPTVGPDNKLRPSSWTADATLHKPFFFSLHSEICGGVVPREVMEFNQFGPPSHLSTFVYIYPKALNLMSSVTEFNMNVVLKITFKRDDSNTNEGDPESSYFISRAWESDWKFFTLADSTVKCIQPLFHDELKAVVPFPFKRGDHFVFSFYKVNLQRSSWFSSKSNQPKTFPATGIPFHPDTFSYMTIGHCIVPIANLFSSSSVAKSAILSEDVLCDIGELPLYKELQPGYLSKLQGGSQKLSVVEQCMFSLSFRVVSPWCTLDPDIINYFGITNVDLYLRKRFDWMPDVPSFHRENLPEKMKQHILLLCYYSRRSKPLESCKLFPVLMDSLIRNLVDLFSSSRSDPKYHAELSSNSFDPNEVLSDALSVLKPIKSLPKSCSGRGAFFAEVIINHEAFATFLQQSTIRKDSEERQSQLTVLEQILSTDAKRQVMTSECWEILFSCVHLIQKIHQIRDGVVYKNNQGQDLLARHYLRTHFDLPAHPRSAPIASFPNMILFSLVSAIEYLIDRKKAEPSIIPFSEEIKTEKPAFASSWFSLPPNISVPQTAVKPNDVAITSAMNMISQSWFWLGSVLKSMVLMNDSKMSSVSEVHDFFQRSMTVDLIELFVISSSKFLSCITTCNMQRNFKDSGSDENDMVCLLDEIELKDLANCLNDSVVRFLLDLFPILDINFVNGCLDCYMDFDLRMVNQEKLLQKADLRLRLDSIERIVSFDMLFQYTKTQKLPATISFEDVKAASSYLYPLASLVMKEVEFYVLQKFEDIEFSCLSRLCSILIRLLASVTTDLRYQKEEIYSVVAHALISIVPIMIDCEKNGSFFGKVIPEIIPDGCCNENILVIVMFHVVEMFGFAAFALLFNTAKSDSLGAFCRLLIRYLRVIDGAQAIPSQSDVSSPPAVPVVSELSDSRSTASFKLSGFSHKRVLALLQCMIVAKQWNDCDIDHETFHHIWTVLMEILESATEELCDALQFLLMMVGTIESHGPARAMFFGSVRNPSSSDGSSYACARWNEAVGHLARLAFLLDLSEAHDDGSHTQYAHNQSIFMKSQKTNIALQAQGALNVFVAPYQNVDVPLPAVPDDYVAPDLGRIDDSPADVQSEEVKSMTPAAIILSLSQYKTMPVTLLDEVLVTYRSYCQPLYLLHQLIDRYRQLSGLQDDGKLQKDKVSVCQARVMNNLSKWIREYFHDMRPSPPLTSRLLVFLIDVLKKSKEIKVSKQLCKALLNKQSQPTDHVSETAKWPESVMPATPQASVFRFLLPAKKVKNQAVDVIFHWAPKEIARQMCLIESTLFKAIQASEFMNQNWAKRPHLAPNIKASQDRFNLVARWVAWQILQRNSVEERATVLERFYEITLYLRDFQNFNSCLQLISGLGNAGVFRLKKTLALIKERDETKIARGERFWWGEAGLVDTYMALRDDMAQTSNYKKMRSIMDDANSDGGPVHNGIKYCGIVPYIGIFQSDFTFLDEGSPTFLSPAGVVTQLAHTFSNSGLVNLKKVKVFSSAIKRIKEFQAKTYSFHLVPQLRDSLMNLDKPMFDVEAKEEEALYKRSLEVEPRETVAAS